MSDANLPKWRLIDGMKYHELPDHDGICVALPGGRTVELSWRKSEQVLSLSCDGQLVISPVSANVVRVEVKR